jgi:hypothetical protein
MTIPQFTAEAALYQTNEHYRTGRQVIQSLPRPIIPTAITSEVPREVPGENIPLHSCAPGWEDIGGMCWPVPMTESPSSGGPAAPGGGSAGSGPGGGGVGGGPMTPPKKPPTKRYIITNENVPPKKGFNPKQGRTCYGLKLEISAGGDPIIWDDPFKGKYESGVDGSWFCKPKVGDSIRCNEKDVWNNGDEDIKYCYNKKPPNPPV